MKTLLIEIGKLFNDKIYLMNPISGHIEYISEGMMEFLNINKEKSEELHAQFFDASGLAGFGLFSKILDKVNGFIKNKSEIQMTQVTFLFNTILYNRKVSSVLHHELALVNLITNQATPYLLGKVTLGCREKMNDIYFKTDKQFQSYSHIKGRWVEVEHRNLTECEQKVLSLSAQGYTIKEIANLMNKAYETVKDYRRGIFVKLNVNNISAALTYAHNLRLL